LAGQILAALARARQVRELAELVGASALSTTDRSYLAFEQAFERDFMAQRSDESRAVADSLDDAWRALSVLPKRELTMITAAMLDKHLPAAITAGGRAGHG
jgi:V/A-type H+-transporting ATPase subunit B